VRALTFLARRFVAGDTLEEAMEVVARLNGQGFKVTLDHLGEETLLPGQAGRDVYEYARMLQAIADSGADCNVSLKLTQLGLSLDRALARENLERILV
jgi:proline dehydrogenase